MFFRKKKRIEELEREVRIVREEFERDRGAKIELQNEMENLNIAYIPKSKVKELAKKYEFALNGYDSSTADYKHSQNLGRYLACVELLEEGE